jgi:hypothetical protein
MDAAISGIKLHEIVDALLGLFAFALVELIIFFLVHPKLAFNGGIDGHNCNAIVLLAQFNYILSFLYGNARSE